MRSAGEYSYVLEGRMGALLGDEVACADAGEFKPETVTVPCAEHGLDHPLLHMG